MVKSKQISDAQSGAGVEKLVYWINTPQTFDQVGSNIVVASYTIPAGTLNPNSRVRFRGGLTTSSSSTGKNPRLQFGGVTIKNFTAITNVSVILENTVFNRNSLTSQRTELPLGDVSLLYRTTQSFVNLSVNTANSVDCRMLVDVATGDTIVREYFTVYILNP